MDYPQILILRELSIIFIKNSNLYILFGAVTNMEKRIQRYQDD